MVRNVERHLDAQKACASEILIAPIDRLGVPPELDGSKGEFRHQRPGALNANTDLEAVKHWLRQYEDKPSTYRAYQQAVERLINWALVERQKAISSLNDSDLIAFEEFLSDPQPRWRWICLRATARSDPNWTPLAAPLSPRSRLYTLVALRVMFEWLNNMGYCDVGRSLWRHSTHSRYRPSGLMLTISTDLTPKIIGFDDWQLLQRSINMDTTSIQQIEACLTVNLMYYGCLTVKEVESVCLHHIFRTNRAMLLHIPSRPPDLATIYLVPPIAMVINRLFEIPETAYLGDIAAAVANNVEKANSPTSPCPLISRRTIKYLIKEAFHRAAEVAVLERNMAAAARLMALPPNSLRHAFEIHAQGHDDKNWIWMLIGAAHLVSRSTRQYVPRRELTDNEVEHAYRSLAPCWEIVGIQP